MKNRYLIYLILLLAACTGNPFTEPSPEATAFTGEPITSPTPSLTATSAPAAGGTATPTVMATATPAQIATPTALPSVTPLPELVTTANNTAFQLPNEPISPANLDQIVELASWGRGVINDVAYSADGRWLAVGASTGVYVHETQDLSQAPRAYLTPDSVSMVDISFDGALAAVAFSGAIELWDLANQARLWRKAGRFTTLQFAPDGQHLATVSADGGAVWSLAGEQMFQSLGNVLAMKFSADGSRLAAWSYGLLSVYSWPDGQLLAENQPILFENGENAVAGEEIPAQGTIVGDVRFNHENEIILLNLPGNMAYGPTGRIELQRGSDDTLLLSLPPIEQLSAPVQAACEEPIVLADPLTGPQVWKFELATDTQIVALRYQKRGFAGDDNEYAVVRFHHLETGDLLYEQTGVNAFTLAPDGATWVAGRTDGRLEVRRTSDGELQQSYDGYDSPITELAISPDGALLAVTYLNEIKLYEAATGLLLRRYPARRLAFAPDGLAVAIGYEDGLVEMRAVQDDALLQQLAAHSGPISALAFTPSGETLVSASLACELLAWPLSAAGSPLVMENHLIPIPYASDERGLRLKVTQLAITADGERLIGAFLAGVGLWSLEDGSLRQVVELSSTLGNIAFSSHTDRLAISTSWRLWQLQPSDQWVELWQTHAPSTAVAFSPDGQLLLAGLGENYVDESFNGAITLHQSVDGTRLHQLTPGTRKVTALAFAPDGHYFISAALDGVVRLWGTD